MAVKRTLVDLGEELRRGADQAKPARAASPVNRPVNPLSKLYAAAQVVDYG